MNATANQRAELCRPPAPGFRSGAYEVLKLRQFGGYLQRSHRGSRHEASIEEVGTDSVRRGVSPRFALPRSRLLPRVALVLLAGVGGCPQRTAVWVEQGSTAPRVVFGVAEKRGGTRPVAVGVLRVQQCGGPTSGSGAWWAPARAQTVCAKSSMVRRLPDT
jgi:hypothetical protein